MQTIWNSTYGALGTVQFIHVVLGVKMTIMDPFVSPPSVAQLQAAIEATASKPEDQRLTLTQYPIVAAENGDWAEYIDEYDAFGSPAKPGIAVIDQTGHFYSVRFGEYDEAAGVDWVVTRLEEFLNPREPVDTILALDRSGSMSLPPPSGGPDPKIEILQDAVGAFLDVWEVMSVPGDRVGVFDFADDLCYFISPSTGELLSPLSSEVGLVDTYVGDLIAGGYTCFGAPLGMALDELADSPHRHIILFSDGMQNTNPMLADTAGGDIEILNVDPADVGDHDYVEWVYGDSGFPDKPGQPLSGFGTHIHTIGVGLSASPWTDLMSAVALQTDATHFETPAPEVDLQNFYISDLLESFKGATPQLVRHQYGTITPDSVPLRDSCAINSSAKRLTVMLSWEGDPETHQLLCALEAPDGTLVEIDGRTKTAARRKVISLPLPPYHRGRILDHAGLWRLHIMGKVNQAVSYQVFWIVDDHLVHLELGRFDKAVFVGQTIKFTARLLKNEKPVPAKEISKAQAIVYAPTVDFNRFFASYQVSPAKLRYAKKQMKWPGPHTDSAVKLFVLSRDKEAVAKCTKTVQRRVKLEPKRGALSGTVTFKKPGVHRFRLEVGAKDRKKDRIVRTLNSSLYVRPKEVK